MGRERRLWGGRVGWPAAFLGAVAAACLASAPALAAKPPDRKVVLKPGNGPAEWDGQLGNGSNQDYDSATGKPCGSSPEEMCDVTLLKVRVPDGYWDRRGGGAAVALENYTVPSSDFDLYIYRTNRTGERVGQLVDVSGGVPGEEELAEIPEADGFYRIHVVYFAVVASSYEGSAKFAITGRRAPRPPDVDQPPGLQDVLASDPDKGYRSHSEMHLAQSPLDPDLLIAGSKFYNKDPDSLREYEFKIGTYISFNGGRSWHDLGQTRDCRARRAPPRTWPTENLCYPRDKRHREGTGEEDGGPGQFNAVPAKLRGEVAEIGRPFRKFGNVNQLDPERRGKDYGEEYITSDPWVQFDDAGNAYLMLLDSPPFDHGNGWGMSFHRWKTPSRRDLKERRTWSKRIIINAYPDEPAQSDFLDDKNTFAVNNAGPDDDEPGPIVACWGQNIDSAIKQQTVCERSTDGGRSWPGEPVPISPPSQQLVIGVSVIADNVNPDRFYATWFNYTPTVGGEPGEYWFSQSLDGGMTWTPATLVTQVNDVPTQFPGSQFRNLSIPIMAAGPAEGELYTTYTEYLPASADDFDQKQADIRLVRSTDGGGTWTDPQTVNAGPLDADQFQPAPAVTPAGQVNISYFDLRRDPDNFYIDTYLSRSNNGGQTFEDVRVSHDPWDPNQRPPISPSGEFIGDYQGLVADDCAAIPFVNDTHLANGARRDPDFDAHLPRSPFQEAISWRVPNKARFGGEPVPGTDC